MGRSEKVLRGSDFYPEGLAEGPAESRGSVDSETVDAEPRMVGTQVPGQGGERAHLSPRER